MKPKLFTVRLSPATIRAIKLHAALNDMTMQEVVSTSVETFLKAHKKEVR